HLLRDRPDLEPRDVIVMCPDIETYAPLIQAAFGVEEETGGPGGPSTLRVRLADRSLRQTNPLLTVAAELLELAGSRVGAPQVIDLIAQPPVARRFRLDQEDLADIERWVADSAIRWGLDGDHRRPWSLSGLRTNTWSAGLDRLMLGVAMAETGGRMFADTVPFDDMTSGRTDLAGRFAELVARLAKAVDRLTPAQPLDTWIEALIESTESLAVSAPDEDWQHDEMRVALGEAAAGDGPFPALGLDEVRALLAEQLRGRPTRANFRTGDLTICTLVPMRSVPHRVVALLGLDDGAFPRHPEVDGDDLLLAAPRVGDRDARSEDRQLLLDALLAASDHLIITYSGRDERTNRVRPPCAPVSELLDVVDATAGTVDGRAGRQAVVVHHPLQPFDPRNFIPGDLVAGTAWSFDAVFRAGAEATVGARVAEGRASEPLPPLAEPYIQLEHLIAFAQHPMRAFLRRRLSLYLGDYTEQLSDRMPLELDGLARWELGDRLLEAVLSGVELSDAITAEQSRGFLPPGELAGPVLQEVGGGVVGIAGALFGRGFTPGPSDSAQVRISLPDSRLLVGTVPQIRDRTVVQCVYSRLAAKHRLAGWVRFLALVADRPEMGASGLTIGKGIGRGTTAVSSLPAVGGSDEDRRQWAVIRLAALVDLYDRGMCQPLPLACNTSAKWAEGRKAGWDDDELLSNCTNEWVASGLIPGERDDAEHTFYFGRYADFRRLLEEEPALDESGRGWPAAETHRFGRLAGRLWAPLLAHEELNRG
ncbi:MAG TPA: hypothetical protein VG435_01990, partial [Acidimicrobiales bacterium]|nr:hypothetical protein [Acidimicrobiales bacterium]